MTFESVIECNVSLNVHELGIILSALQLLTSRDENQIAKDYGSASTLHNRLKEVYDSMDQSTLNFHYDVEPSF